MRLINTYDQLRAAVTEGVIAKEQSIFISYYAYTGRGSNVSGWRVSSPFFAVDPNAHWSEHGNKVFLVGGRDGKRNEVLPKVKEWVKEKYGVDEWAFNRAQAYVPAIVNKTFPLPKREKGK